MSHDYDFIIIGSGFGGSVSALRLAEKGYRVCVLEQGREVSPEDMQAAAKKMNKLLWLPPMGWKGFFSQEFFRHLSIVRGIGVGGGSLVYGAVLLQPKDAFFKDPAWAHFGLDWKQELNPHYQTAEKMLGKATNPHYGLMDDYLQETAQAMQVGNTFGPVPQGIYFDHAGQEHAGHEVEDPFFEGKGPKRMGCVQCGNCFSGCSYGSKNSLDKNYLHLAKNLGVEILSNRKVLYLSSLESKSGYAIESIHPFTKKKYPPLKAKKVILAAGVLGSLEILYRSRDDYQTLPQLSPQLGKKVRTNSEAIVPILSQVKNMDLTEGAAISSDFYPDSQTHITQNRFPPSYEFMKMYLGPMVDDPVPWRRALKTLTQLFLHPWSSTRPWRTKDWYKKVTVLTVMQNLESQIALKWGRKASQFFQKGLTSSLIDGQGIPAYIPQANKAARTLAQVSQGTPYTTMMESVLNLSVTAHILGGCAMGQTAEEGVINANHEVHGYPGLYVVDGSAIPANVGVNPSLTITAMAERCMSLMPNQQAS